MKISMVAAMTHDRVIGQNNELLWHLPKDFEWFKEKTMGYPVIMGRKTFESIGKPLPGRKNIVLSRSDFRADGVIVVKDVAQAMTEACWMGKYDEAFVIGGEQIYKRFLRHTHRLYITFVNADLEGDAFFPEWGNDWEVSHSEFYKADAKNAYDMRFLILDKKIGNL